MKIVTIINTEHIITTTIQNTMMQLKKQQTLLIVMHFIRHVCPVYLLYMSRSIWKWTSQDVQLKYGNGFLNKTTSASIMRTE